MPITSPQCRAARALVQWPLDHIARLSGLPAEDIAAFERGTGHLDDDAKRRLAHRLEEGGAVFIAEDSGGGIGVRLRFTAKDVRAINRMEGEGGPVGDDDI
ncbi:MAG: DNA-binding protein [Sphingobium sp.]